MKINDKVNGKVVLSRAKAEESVLKTMIGRVLSVLGVGENLNGASKDTYKNIDL